MASPAGVVWPVFGWIAAYPVCVVAEAPGEVSETPPRLEIVNGVLGDAAVTWKATLLLSVPLGVVTWTVPVVAPTAR